MDPKNPLETPTDFSNTPQSTARELVAILMELDLPMETRVEHLLDRLELLP